MEAYLSNCTPTGLDYCMIFNGILLMLYLAVFFVSNLVLRCYTGQGEELNFSCPKMQCSVIKTVIIGVISVIGFLVLILAFVFTESLESNANIGICIFFSISVIGLYLRKMLKERKFPFPFNISSLDQMKGTILCRENAVYPLLPLHSYIQSISSQVDDDGIFIG